MPLNKYPISSSAKAKEVHGYKSKITFKTCFNNFVKHIFQKTQNCKTSILLPLWVLLWKSLKERKRRYCHTFWEIFGGISIFLVLLLVNYSMTDEPATGNKIVNGSDSSVARVFYTPDNNFTRRLMEKVKYNLRNNTKLDLEQTFEWDIQSMDAQYSNIDETFNDSSVTVVNFKNIGSNETKLLYSLKMAGVEKTGFRKSFNGFFRSLIPKEKSYPPYLGILQWTIDKSYLEQLAEHDILQNLHMRAKPEYISKELQALHKFIILCTIIAPLPHFLISCSRLVALRRSGLKEMMKLVGVSFNVFRLYYLLETTILAILYAAIVTTVLKVTSKPILPYSSSFIIAFTMMLHYINSAVLACVTTTLSEDYNYADSFSLFVYLSTFFLYFDDTKYLFVVYLCCIVPHGTIIPFWEEVLYLETIGQGTQFFNAHKKHTNHPMSVIKTWIFSFLHLAILLILSWYLDQVRPGRYGVSKKWNFMLKRPYWSRWCKKKTVNFHITAEQTEHIKRDERFFERGPRKAEVAIKILNVSKVFKPSRKIEVTALDSISFDCYSGEVTVLLGTNGAGKTTLLSIVTGMYRATAGLVYVKGKDVAHRIHDLRDDIGLCTQRNLNFSYLTVKENIMFFEKLNAGETEFTAEHLMKKLKLTDKANSFANALTAGMLRCLQVACTLVGGKDVLVLDEPTSGMDVNLRHRLWDLIMMLRGKKTILMSTTHLEEANALGDRIVILNNGVLRCHGTPMFLKNALGTSFNLSITIKDSTQMKRLMDMVEDIIPTVKYRIQDIKRITFSVPSNEHEKFPELFDTLEEKKTELGISFMDVGMFMEDVFLEFIEEEEDSDPFAHTSISYRHVATSRLEGIKLILRQIKILFLRVYKYSWRNKYQFVILQLVIPIVGLLLVTLITNRRYGQDKMFGFPKIQSHSKDVHVLVYNTGPYRRSRLMDAVNWRCLGVDVIYSDDIDSDFTQPHAGYMDEQTIGLKMSEYYTTIFHPSDPKILSESINMFSNIHMMVHMPFFNHSISTLFEPITRGVKTIVEPKSMFLCLKWSVWVVIISVLPLAPLIMLCITEYRTGTRDNHMMAGCWPIVHWSSKLLAHIALYLVIIPVPVVLMSLLLDFDKTFNQPRFIGSLMILLIAFAPAFLAHLYLLSFILNENYAICQLYIMSICFGIIFPILMSALEMLWQTHVLIAIPYLIFVVVFRFSPLFVCGIGLSRLALQARLNALCRANFHHCPGLVIDDDERIGKICCETHETHLPFKYLESYDTALYDLLTLIFQFIAYSSVVILLENRVIQYIIERMLYCTYKRPLESFNNENVQQEKDYVKSALKKRDYENDVLLVHDVHKNFWKRERFNAVHGVSFAAKLGECIAILGPIGSGKTTILKMLAGSFVMTRGTACVDGQFIRQNRSKYIHKISLASRTGGLDSFMTAHQNLIFIAKLLGYCDEMSCKLSQLALRFMGIKPDAMEVSQFSHGYLRRLSLCSTLVLSPRVALLDDPMSYIDPAFKAVVAKAMQRLMLEPAVVVVTQTCVDWRQMQPIFSRIALMMNGQLAALGPAEEVIGTLANGYMARIKLTVVTAYREDMDRKLDDDEDSSSLSEPDSTLHSAKSLMYARGVVDFKREFKKIFRTSKLVAEHLCMLFFFIEDVDKTHLYGDMFNKLEMLRKKYPDVVEDYTLNSTTVEDVFWRLAHERERKQ